MLENYSYTLVKFSIFTKKKNDKDKFDNFFNFSLNPFK